MKRTNELAIWILTMIVAISTMNCTTEKVNPQQALNEDIIPSGMYQTDQVSADIKSRLEELKLQNPKDHFYYLAFEEHKANNTSDWLFPQKELKIEHVDNQQNIQSGDWVTNGLIVKRITGDYNDEVFMVVDELPKPEDGLEEFYGFISSNMKYPLEARKAGIEGKVFIEFTVDKNGDFTNLNVARGIDKQCDEEAIRVLKEAPSWVPGKLNKKPVRVKMILPISYRLK